MVVSAFLIGLPVSLAGLSYEFGMKKGVARAQAAEETLAAEEARERAEALADMAVEAERRLESMTLLLAELQSRVTRLDAVGMNLTQSAGLEPGEFNFDMAPALGGPLMTSQEDARELIPALEGELFALSTALDDREVQLDILSELIQGEQVKSDATPSGRPILSGWLSSRYGTRIDPFSGKKAWHEGVDFAGKAGSDIVAVASGVVSWSGERYGYGKMVEVAHGDGVIVGVIGAEGRWVDQTAQGLNRQQIQPVIRLRIREFTGRRRCAEGEFTSRLIPLYEAGAPRSFTVPITVVLDRFCYLRGSANQARAIILQGSRIIILSVRIGASRWQAFGRGAFAQERTVDVDARPFRVTVVE